MNIGYCCINLSLGNKGKFRTMTVKKATSMNEQDRLNELQKRTRENFDNLYDIIKWNVEHRVKLYRVSSDMCPLHTHEICNYDYKTDDVIIDLANKIKIMCEENDILLSIHCDQFHVIASDREEVFQNTVKGLQYHYDLMQLLGIKYNCIHVGSKKGGIELAKERFVNNFMRMPKHLQQSIMLENDDKSYNVSDTLELCELLEIPMVYDMHHSRIKPSEKADSEYIDRIINTWGDDEPIGHISSSADSDKLISKHHDFVSANDMNMWYTITKGRVNVEMECKKKDLAWLEIVKEDLVC